MNLSDDVDLEDYVARPDKISGADINAICQEAGMHAVRENRYVLTFILSFFLNNQFMVSQIELFYSYIVLAKDFEKGYKNNIKKDEQEHEFYK